MPRSTTGWRKLAIGVAGAHHEPSNKAMQTDERRNGDRGSRSKTLGDPVPPHVASPEGQPFD
jgi:hypothetical protein